MKEKLARYRAGGARGEIAPEDTEAMKLAAETISSRLATSTMAMLGEYVATAEPAVEQMGQI